MWREWPLTELMELRDWKQNCSLGGKYVPLIFRSFPFLITLLSCLWVSQRAANSCSSSLRQLHISRHISSSPAAGKKHELPFQTLSSSPRPVLHAYSVTGDTFKVVYIYPVMTLIQVLLCSMGSQFPLASKDPMGICAHVTRGKT